MAMRQMMVGLVLLAASNVLARADTPAPVYTMQADGDVQIATDGRVSDYHLTSKLSDEIAQLVERNVRNWHFDPIVVDGQPVVAKTAMRIQLIAEPADPEHKNYRLRVARVRFGDPALGGMTPPAYPGQALRAQVGARSLIWLHLDANGNVIDAQPFQTNLDRPTQTEQQAELWRAVFERAGVKAAQNWHFKITETIGGKPLGTTVIAPIDYTPGTSRSRTNSDGVWKSYIPGPTHPAPWLKSAEVAGNQDYSDLKIGEVRALDSRFQLKDDVVGKTL